MSDCDQHAADLMALMKELSELEFRRGVLHARLEWHFRLRDLAATTPPVPARPATGGRRRGQVQAAILAALAERPGQTCSSLAAMVGRSAESVRQVLTKLRAHGRVTKTGGRYAVAESHAGSGLVAS